jgi:hypothetical protein
MGRLTEAKKAYREAKIQGKEAKARFKADKLAHPEQHTWRYALEQERLRFRPTPEELMPLAETAKVIYVGQSTTPIVFHLSFNPAGLKTYVSLNREIFHEIPHLPEVMTREFAREIASLGHASHDGKWRSPVTGMQYGGCWTLGSLLEPATSFNNTHPHVVRIEQYLIGEPTSMGPVRRAGPSPT